MRLKMGEINKKQNVNAVISQRLDEFLSDYMDKKELTLKELCGAYDLSYSHVSQIRRGKKALTFQIAYTLSKKCKLDLNYLAGGKKMYK